MKKILLFIIIISSAIWLFTAISKHTEDTRTTIKFSSWGSQSEIALLIPLLKDFEKKNPDIKVDFIHIPQNYFPKLHLLFASNLAPDVVFINNHYAPKYVKAGLLEDLTPYIEQEKYFTKSLDCFTFDKKIYAIPRDISNLVIYYNKDIFKKYSIKEPASDWTMEDFLRTTLTLKNISNGKIMPVSYETDPIFWLPYVYSNGGSLLDKNGALNISDKKFLDSVDLYAAMANKYNIAPKKSDSASLTMAQLFLQERLAMHLSGRWLVPKYRSEAKFDWDIAPFPKGKAGSIVNIDASGYALSKNSKHKDESIKFIKYISSQESLNSLAQSGLIVPARKDSAYSDTFLDKSKKPKNAYVFLKTIETGRTTNVNENYQQITDRLNSALEPVFLGQKKAGDVITRRLLIELSRYAY